jgi:predicted transcriptional regulator of viral defense system
MSSVRRDVGLQLLDQLVAEDQHQFTAADAATRLGRSPTATSNLLRRLLREGLVDRVRRGRYAIRQLGTLGTRAAAQDVLLAVAAGFHGTQHRLAYRSALDHLELLVHPSRSIQVALTRPTRSETLSGRALTTVLEPEEAVLVGAEQHGGAYVSDLERALLDAAARPELVGGVAVLAAALSAGATRVDPEQLRSYAERLRWGAALRRIGSLADTLALPGLAGTLTPLAEPTSDLDLEPGADDSLWRDSKWRIRWDQNPEQLANVVGA